MISSQVAAMMEGAREIEAAMTDPDGDWIPVLAVVNDEGETAVVDVAAFFQSYEHKRLFGEVVLPKLIEDMSVREVILINSSWMSPEPSSLPIEERVRPSEDPDRVEKLLVTQITAEGVKLWAADITRDPLGHETPKLGVFEQFNDGHIAYVSGLIVDEAFRKLQERAS